MTGAPEIKGPGKARWHHLIEKRFAQLLGINPDDIPSVLLTWEEHVRVTEARRQMLVSQRFARLVVER